MRLALLACLTAALFAVERACAAPAAAEKRCYVEDFETPVRCITFDAPRDYDRPADGVVKLTAVIIPASTGRPSPDPLVILAGGPGQSATSLPSGLPALISEVRKTRDIVLFDLRGTGLSEPLICSGAEEFTYIGNAAPIADASTQIETFAKTCLASLGERTRNHTSREAVEDLELFRQAMGYSSLNLWGGSFGTRIAQHYVRAYGLHARSVILDAAAPAGRSVLASGSMTPDKSLEMVIKACEQDKACAARFPTFRTDLAAILARAEAQPITGLVADPVTGRRGSFRLDRTSLGNAIRVALYSRMTTALLPFAVTEAARDNWSPILGMMMAAYDDQLSMGTQFSMLCVEDWMQADALAPAERTGQLMKDGFYSIFSPACAVWPKDELPPEMLKPFKSTVPALTISGAYDPVTPPELGEQTSVQFSNSRHLVLENGFHTNSGSPCVAEIIGRFLQNPGGPPDKGCDGRMPSLHFFLGAAG